MVCELHDALDDAIGVFVIACDVEDDGVAGLERVDDVLKLFERGDRLTIDAQDHIAFAKRARARVGDDAVRVYVFDVET